LGLGEFQGDRRHGIIEWWCLTFWSLEASTPSSPNMLRSTGWQLRNARHATIATPHRLSTISRRGYAAVTDVDNFPKAGEQLHGFTLKRVKQVPELELTALHLQHDKTGAEYLHIAREDANNVFSIGFKTNPPDATGVPHILEHTTLCGSERWEISKAVID
jgi:hypothetical protein